MDLEVRLLHECSFSPTARQVHAPWSRGGLGHRTGHLPGRCRTAPPTATAVWCRITPAGKIAVGMENHRHVGYNACPPGMRPVTRTGKLPYVSRTRGKASATPG